MYVHILTGMTYYRDFTTLQLCRCVICHSLFLDDDNLRHRVINWSFFFLLSSVSLARAVQSDQGEVSGEIEETHTGAWRHHDERSRLIDRRYGKIAERSLRGLSHGGQREIRFVTERSGDDKHSGHNERFKSCETGE